VVETTLWDDAFKELVANSKFAGWKGLESLKQVRLPYKTTVTMFGIRNIKLKNGIL
jgi:hypothetical protein